MRGKIMQSPGDSGAGVNLDSLVYTVLDGGVNIQFIYVTFGVRTARHPANIREKERWRDRAETTFISKH